MAKYRSRLQIIADVLSVVRDGARKTKIMYQANLSYRLLSRYLGEVLEAGLARIGDNGCYMLTAKGKEFLERFDKYSESRKSVEERLSEVLDQKVILENVVSNAKAVEANCFRKRKERKKK